MSSLTPPHPLESRLKALLTASHNPTHIQITDVSGGCGSSFDVLIVSEKFEGKNRLDRQRSVNTSIKEVMGEIHALTQVKAKKETHNEIDSTPDMK